MHHFPTIFGTTLGRYNQCLQKQNECDFLTVSSDYHQLLRKVLILVYQVIPFLLLPFPGVCNFELPDASPLRTTVLQPAMACKILSLCLMMQAFIVHADRSPQTIQRRQVLNPSEACDLMTNKIAFCAVSSSGFYNLPPKSQASCLCYSIFGTTTLWAPDMFDGAVFTCEVYSTFSDPPVFGTIDITESFCANAGNVLGQSTLPATIPLTVPTYPTTIQTVTTSVVPMTAGPIMGMTYPPCATVASLVASCISATASFEDLNGGHQGLCLCWSAGVMIPDLFDVPMLSCANYLQTANPSFYSNVSALEGFCTNWNGVVQSLLPAVSYEQTTITLNTNTFTSTLITTTNSITTNPSTANSTPTATASSKVTVTSTSTSNAGSSLQGVVFTKLFSVVAAVAFGMVFRF